MTDDGDILRAVGKLEGKLDGLSARMGESNRATVDSLAALRIDVEKISANQNTRINNHSERLRSLEKRQSWFLGGLATIPVIGTVAVWVWNHWQLR